MGFTTLLYEVSDGVATLTLNRPERHNAINIAMARELCEAWTQIKRDPAVVCVIVTGAGDKAFCTGFDVAEVAAGDTAGWLAEFRVWMSARSARDIREGFDRTYAAEAVGSRPATLKHVFGGVNWGPLRGDARVELVNDAPTLLTPGALPCPG